MSKILIIEDNPVNRELISDILVQEYEIIIARDGYQGIQMALAHKPDLIVCDIMMPKIDGFGVLKTIRDSVELNHIPFVFLTARAEKSDLRSGMDSGADDYLTKPFTADELLQAVSVRLKRKQELNNELKQRVREIFDTLNTTSSHEFNTPLNAIIGFTSLMISNYQKLGKEDMLNMLATIKKSSKRLQKTTNNILLYSYLQKFNDPAMNYQAGVTEECSSVISGMVSKLAELCHFKDKYTISLVEADVSASEDDLSKIVEEIVSNAFLYSSENTRVAIESVVTNGLYVIKITNSGRGISREDIMRIGPYMQFERKQYEQQGMGLGLYLSKRLTELNNGKFEIASEKDVKTEVVISLPLTPGKQ